MPVAFTHDSHGLYVCEHNYQH